MLTRRIVACIDVRADRVVKGTRFVDLRDQGDPVALAARYGAEGADEVTFLDISATVEERAPFLEVVRRTAERLFVPLTVGGGLRSVEDVEAALRAGADKVAELGGGPGSGLLPLRGALRASRPARRPVVDERWQVVAGEAASLAIARLPGGSRAEARGRRDPLAARPRWDERLDLQPPGRWSCGRDCRWWPLGGAAAPSTSAPCSGRGRRRGAKAGHLPPTERRPAGTPGRSSSAAGQVRIEA
jgi:hypothetical protein